MTEKSSLSQIRPLYQYLRQQAENKKIAKYLEISATFIFITIFLFFAIKPTALAISSLLGEIKSKELASQKMKTKINSLIQAQNSFSEAQGEKYLILESGFPSNPQFYQAANNFSVVSNQSGVPIQELNFNLSNLDTQDKQDKKDDSLIKSFSINLSTDTQYQTALSFIQKLLENRRLIDISSINFSRSEDQDSNLISNSVKLNINSNLFYSPIETNEKN